MNTIDKIWGYLKSLWVRFGRWLAPGAEIEAATEEALIARKTLAVVSDPVLIERTCNAERYDNGDGTRSIKTGGDIDIWTQPFFGGDCRPWDFTWAEGEVQGNWRWFDNTPGYLVKTNTSTVRVFPVAGDQTKYIQISGMADQVSTANQIDADHFEIYIDQAFTRWSLKMGPDGFKPEIILKAGWTGDAEWQFRFELNGGLTLEGAKIMDDSTPVLRLHNPFVIDNNSTVFPAQESLVDGVATITSDLTGAVFPCTVDPTLGPINATKDTYLNQGAPTTGFGQDFQLVIEGASGASKRPLHLFDISAIPTGSIVVSSTFEYNVFAAVAGSVNKDFKFVRCTRTDWEDASGANAEANWTNYESSGPTAWTTAGGDIDVTVQDTGLKYPGGVGFFPASIPIVTQDAIDNRSGILSAVEMYEAENAVSGRTYYSLERATAADRPKLTVVYTEGGDDVLMGGGFGSDSILMGHGFSN